MSIQSTLDKSSWLPVWQDKSGTPLACKDKLAVLNETFEELQQVAQDALEDAILIGCDEKQVHDAMMSLIARLENPYKDKS